MNEINNTEAVKKQYETAVHLNTRISIHDKYSVNKIGFGNWIFSNYRIKPNMKILELGCGTGGMWKGKDAIVASCSRLILSDISEGMIAAASKNLKEYKNIEYHVVDIQDIPYEDGAFDIVIANMMLYHVPDLLNGLNEVRRVLKNNGSFYCATYGIHGIVEYLSDILKDYGVENTINQNFTLQNGYQILKKVFQNITKLEYKDSLAVTSADDMIDYIYSLSGMTPLSGVPRAEIKEVLLRHMKNGVLSVPKEYGMFVAS